MSRSLIEIRSCSDFCLKKRRCFHFSFVSPFFPKESPKKVRKRNFSNSMLVFTVLLDHRWTEKAKRRDYLRAMRGDDNCSLPTGISARQRMLVFSLLLSPPFFY